MTPAASCAGGLLWLLPRAPRTGGAVDNARSSSGFFRSKKGRFGRHAGLLSAGRQGGVTWKTGQPISVRQADGSGVSRGPTR
jgi:hypothetical protein